MATYKKGSVLSGSVTVVAALDRGFSLSCSTPRRSSLRSFFSSLFCFEVQLHRRPTHSALPPTTGFVAMSRYKQVTPLTLFFRYHPGRQFSWTESLRRRCFSTQAMQCIR
jgi:hypothetical protein